MAIYNPYQSFSVPGQKSQVDEWTNPMAKQTTETGPATQTITEAPTTATTRSVVEGMSPEEINAAYEGSYGGILRNPDAFRVSPTAAADYYNRLESQLTGQGMESIGGELAARGYAPQGGGTMGQLYGQLRSDIGLKRAGAELGLEEGAVERRGAFAGQGAAAQYAALVNRRRTTTQDQTTTPGVRTIGTTGGTQTAIRYGPSGFGGFSGMTKSPYGELGPPRKETPSGAVAPAAPLGQQSYPGNINEGFNLRPPVPANWDYPFAGGEYPMNPYGGINPLLPNERT